MILVASTIGLNSKNMNGRDHTIWGHHSSSLIDNSGDG
jgi:hypothetical protein